MDIDQYVRWVPSHEFLDGCVDVVTGFPPTVEVFQQPAEDAADTPPTEEPT
jgi:hypothetical protein